MTVQEILNTLLVYSAPWLRGSKRNELCSSLEEIFLENIGECIIYLWVERIREFLQELVDTELEEVSATDGTSIKKDTEEVDDGDDSFELDAANSHSPATINVRYLQLSQQDVQTGYECPIIHHGEPFTERRSTFQAHLAEVTHVEQIKLVFKKLFENKKIANATHNILGYRIEMKSEPHECFMQGCDDDGEHHAGSRVLHLMQIIDVRNVMVVVTRWYGGILLGPDRYKYINNSARQILEEHGFIKDKGAKKGPKSSSSKHKSSRYK
ncbi:protein IMPACT-like isoform X2 [Tubulanus polymorphus]|uniref:protein IMPACT-like isoform X2 n=1 Tax=Tubulanus polymorphus TaxID=672921 RepID=UPI003DA56834